jgi:hypothetical protein
MKSFETLVLVRQPVERLWATVRDRLPDLVPSIDEVETVVVLERDEVAPGRTRIVNEWRSTQHIPAVLAKALHATEIGWIDRSEWDSVTRVCRWSIEPSVLGEHIECRGTTTYASAMGGRGSRITFAGSFDLAPGALGKLAGPLERPVAAFVESMVTTLIPKNARSVFEAAAALVDTEVGS